MSKIRHRRIVGLSLGATLVTIIVMFAAMAFAPDASAANTCTLTSTSPITLWGDVTKWSGCGGTYPGQGAGDTAIVSLGGGYTLKVDAFNNPVVLQISGSASSIPIQVASGGTLTLQTSSTATSNNTFTVDSGGTMGTNSGANITGFQGGVHVNGGTFNSAGTIQLTAGTFTYSGGSLTGSGTISITNSAIFDGAVGSMPVSGTTINSSGFLSYTSASNAVTLSSGASINITAGTFSVATDAAINGTATEAINIASGGTMLKTSGTGLNVISPFVKNDGTINVSGAGAGGGFGLSGNGTHSGSFVTGSSSQTIAFGGNNSFNSGAAFSGATPIKFAAGTQTFNAAVTASGGIKWAGGTIAGTGPLTVAGTSFLDGSNSGMILTGVMNNTGAMTYAPANLLTINGASAKLETTGGSFTIAGDYDIQAVPSGAGTLKISGGTGSVTKSAGGTGSSILAFVDVSGGTLTNTATGPLNLAGGGQSTGTLSVPLNTGILNFTNGTFASSGGFSGSGTINVAGGTLNINTATSFGSGSPNFNINLGTLGGTGTVSLLGASTWAGGTVTGSAPFNVSSTGVLTLTGGLGGMTLDGRVLSDQSSVIYNSSTNNLTLKNGASILNSGTFTATGSGMIDTGGSAVSISNNGTFTKTAAGLFVIKPTFNNAVNGVSVTGGVLAIDADGTSSASWTMSPGTEVWFPAPFATTYTWGSGTTFSGGKVTIDGSGNVATSTPLTLTSTNVEMNGGTFTTNAAFTISSPASFKWTDGTLAGAGHTIITSGTTFDMLSEFGLRAMTTHVIDNAGNATMSALTQPINVNSSSTFNNTGTLDIQSDGSMNTDGAGINTFNNTGLVKKSAGGSGFRFDVKYTQSAGTTDANSPTAGSTIIFNGGGTLSGGALQATSSTNFVDFFNATFNLNGGTLNNGQPGALRMTGTTAVVSVNIAASATNFIQNFGTLQGIANLTIPSGGTYTWNGGLMSGTGQFVIASGGTLDVAGGTAQSLSIFSKTISNSGTITYHPLSGLQGNQLTLSGTASIANQSSANINITDNSAFLQSGGATTIVNSGNFQASGNSSVAPTMTNNASGLIKANGGMLTLMAGTSTGTLDAVSPGAINFGSGSTFTITGGTWGNSGGGFWVTGGTVTINAPFSLSGLALNSGQIDGSATLTLTGSNAWGGGTMAGSGTTANSGTLTMSNNSNSFLDTRTFNNTGTVTYQNGGSSLQLKNGAVFNNSNAFNFQGDVGLTCNCATPPLFHNIGTGTITKPAGTGSAVVSAPFTNDGNVAANLGQFVFTTGGAHTGAFSAAANANITFTTGSTFSGTSSLTGAGEITFNGGTSTIGSGTVTSAIFTVNGANVTLNSNATIGTLNVHNAAVLGGTGTIHLTANSPVSEWTGGTINGSGTITVNPGAIFLLDGLTAAMTLDTRPIVNNGILTYISTTNGLILANSAVITNTTGSTLNLDAVPGIGVSGINNAISNAGLLQRGTTGSIGISPAVTNTGTISANLGTLAFNGGLTQTIGSTNLLGGSISSPTTIALAGGTLTGNGTIAAAVNNTNGIVAPGNPSTAGTLTITGAYAQGVNGGMSLKIGGTSNYDIVDATASGVTLGGTLTVSLFNAFTPASGNTFDVLKFSTRSGDFANYFLPTFGGGGSFQNAYVSGTPNVLRLTAVVTASDLMIGQTAPASVLHGQNGTWTLTVTNGPTPVTNVVVTDTFANASFVSATSVGPCTPSGSTVTCNLGSLAANQSVNVSLILNAPNLVTISNNASVTATEFDPNTANNNTGNAFTPVLPSANLSITNTASGNPVNAGSPLSFSIVVANAGPDTSSTVSVSNTFPAGVTSFTFSGAGWSCGPLSGSTATCSIASIPGSSAAPTLLLSMTAPASGPATDSATVSASTADPNGGNNSASQTITITGQADLSITKSGPASVIAGQNAVYTITVTNNGPSSATSVTVTDPAPAGLTFVSNSGGCTGNFPCALGTLTNGQSVTITSTYSTSPGGGGVTVNNIATVASTTADPNSGNNSGSAVTTINSSADLAITKSGPPFSTAGSPIVYTITVTNNGPSDAAAVTVADATPAGTTFVSNAGACTSTFPCALGTMTAGQTKTITTTFTTAPSFAGSSVSNSATVSSTTSDPNAANNTATAVTSFSAATADLSIAKSGPTSATTGSIITYTLTVTNAGPATAANVVVSDPTPAGLTFFNSGGACSGAFPCNLGAMTANQSVTITASYTVTATSGSVINSASVSGTTTDPNPGNDSAAATTTIGAATCNAQPPSLTAPANGSTISSPVTFSWTAVAGATSYKVFASIGGATTQDIGTTTGTSIIFPIAGGSVVWSVQALGVDNCNQLVSASGTFTVCAANTAPTLSVVGTSSAGQSYTVQWTDTGVGTYELQEANNDAFLNPITFQVSGTSRAFTKNTATATAFFYRVRSLSACNQGPGPYSIAQRVVIVPVAPISDQSPSATVDINNKHVVVQTVFIPGQGSALPFIASTDEPWLTVTPSNGILPAAGLTLSVSADPADLPNGTFTATIILTFPGAPAKVGSLDAKPAVTVPVSISVVTPVSPTNLSTPNANSLIIPSVGHLDGINSQWRSDVRITNTSIQKLNYLLRFTPAGGDPNAIKQTQVSISSNDTMALDDIVKNWYGVGALGDAANGVLEIRPLNTSGKGTPNAEDVNISTVTIASSRTFNQSAGGTLGQYIPAIPFANFVGKVTGDARAGILSLQQIAQSPAYRTNLGIVEAAGKATSVLVSVFDASGKNILDIPIDLKAGEQQQLNSFLAAKNITLSDGRVEVKVTGGDGKVTAYASVVDNKTTDPLLVNGVPLVQTPARTFVLPGVADISNGIANWRTDMRVFNAGTDPQYVTLTLYPLAGGATSDTTIARSFTINPGEVSVLDNVLAARFGVTNIGGAMHVDTLADANLVVTGRTYNQVDGGGTYGQYIAAVTPADAVGKGGRTLNVLQVEDSTRYRTNLGIAEVSGKPATVEVSVFLPDAKVAPKVTIPLAANEYRQFRVLQQLGVGTAYNARISIKVTDGDGKITAYGSVIDMQTQDPTYVPAQ